jgi:hypothetical protein
MWQLWLIEVNMTSGSHFNKQTSSEHKVQPNYFHRRTDLHTNHSTFRFEERMKHSKPYILENEIIENWAIMIWIQGNDFV